MRLARYKRSLGIARWKLVCILLLLAVLGWGLWGYLRPESNEPSIVANMVSTHPLTKGSNPDTNTETPALHPSKAHPLDSVLKLANESLERMRKDVVDYTATMVKRERVGGKLSGESKMQMKIIAAKRDKDREVPIHVYLKFELPNSAKGREVIWVDGRNKGLMVAHEAGFLNIARANLDPHGPLAMMGNKYPIDQIGFENLVATLVMKGERDKKIGTCQVEVEDGHEVGGRACRLIQVTHPDKKPEYDFHIAQIMFDTESLLPLRYASYSWPAKPGDEPVLEEEYTYLDVRTNVGLTELDFDPDNKEYKFP